MSPKEEVLLGGYVVDREVQLPLATVTLEGRLTVPDDPRGVVVFAHGSGSSRHSPRNQAVAEDLHAVRLGTLLFDLLTEAEAEDRAKVFDIPLLGRRLDQATRWLVGQPSCRALAVGCFGASTGAGAALWAAAEPGSPIRAVVSRGGRPDLADTRLPLVTAPTLLIVGGADPVVLELNHEAAAAMRCENDIVVVPGATHLFVEPGALAQVAVLAARWFLDNLSRGGDRA